MSTSADQGDFGLLAPEWSGTAVAHATSDVAVLQALLDVEIALARVQERRGLAPGRAVRSIEAIGDAAGYDLAEIAGAARGGGNPVIPLLAAVRGRLPAADAPFLHAGATSQDILDTALMLVASRSARTVLKDTATALAALATLAETHRSTIAAGRTLGQHSVPVTLGLRIAQWLTALTEGYRGFSDAAGLLPVQLGGASGTLASFVEIASGESVALALVDELAAELGLVAGALPWQVRRRPITSFADAATTLSDAYGLFATNVALLSRTEIGELGEPAEEGRGASSAMPQKQNPVLSVLIRSAALRAPDLAAGLHRAALSVDERPDGAWHSEWSPLRELLRLIGGEAELGAELAGGLRVDRERIAANLALSGPLLVSERLAVVLGPILGRKRLQSLIERSMADSAVSLAGLLRGEEGLAAMSDEQLHELLAPQNYVGAAGTLVDRALAHYRQTIADAPPPGESASRGVRA